MAQHGFLGQDFGFLTGNLRSQIGAGGFSPFLTQLLSQGRKDIGRQTRSARESIRESGASSGFRGSSANLFNQLFESEAGALSNLRTGIGGVAANQQSRLIDQLSGLTQFQGGQQLSQARLEELMRQFDITTEEGRRQFNEALAEDRRQFDESQEFNFGDFAGNILGAGALGLGFALAPVTGGTSIAAGAGAAGALGFSDRRLKENIHKTGEKTKDGIPIVTYNYKDDPLKIKYTGVIAQDVEKIKPRAVIKAVDYSKI